MKNLVDLLYWLTTVQALLSFPGAIADVIHIIGLVRQGKQGKQGIEELNETI